MARHVVATVDEIAPGERKIVEIAGRSIGIFNVGGEFFALRNRCPHQGGPLCRGVLWGSVTASAPGEYDYSRPGEILRCPWHGWEFDVRTGQSWVDPARLRVRRYEVMVERGATRHEDLQPPAPGLVPGPYVAETYATSVERAYVVVEIPS
ncbi:MAG TPA: Rieske (2Fe-2S) protein [Chloroflexota bacterium]|nr:Rieske (2Fe-2S) protein [Chloroflexota bacterium]